MTLASTANAQSAPAPPLQPEANADAIRAEPAATEAGDIIVTARKRSESLQDVPASILAVSAAQIANLNAKSLYDLNGALPNFKIDVGGNLTIRGITSTARNAGFEAGAAVYIDGVYQGRPIGNNQDLVDIERVEVLRGPQGTLYGKNTTAGAVSVVTVRPATTWTGRVEAQYAEQDDLRLSGYVAGPIVDDLLGIKLSGFRRRSSGYIWDSTQNDNFFKRNAWGGRGELRVTTGPLDLALRGDYTNDGTSPLASEPVVGFAVVPGRDTVATDTPNVFRRKGGGASLTADVDLGGGYSITSISAWRKLRQLTIGDFDYSSLPILSSQSDERSRQTTQEVRLTSPSSGHFSWILGAYYMYQKLDTARPLTFGAAFPVQGVLNDLSMVDTTSFAAYANADYHLTGALTLNAGLRYTNELKHLDFTQLGFRALGYPDLALKDRFRDTDLSPTAALTYKFSPQISAYAKFSKGYKAGGWNPDITTSARIAFGAESVNNYEIGLRTRTRDGHFSINLTGFYMDYDDLQVSQFLGTLAGYVITNAGKARIKGVEAELSARPVPWLTATASAAYNDARYRDFATGTGVNYAGQQFTNSPAFSGFIGLDARVPVTAAITFKAHADARYQGKVYFDDGRTVSTVVGAFAQDGYALVNLRAGFELSDGIDATVFVDNLTDNRALNFRSADALGLGEILDTYIPPRQVGLRIGYKF